MLWLVPRKQISQSCFLRYDGQANTTIRDASELTLKGSTGLHTVDMDKSSKISLDRFKSKNTNMLSDVYVASRN